MPSALDNDTELQVASLLPAPTVDNEAFWSGCDRGELTLPKCSACGRFSYFPRLLCPHCGSTSVSYAPATGSGTVFSFAHVGFSPFGGFWQQEVPYTVIRADLDIGVRFLSRLVGSGRENVRIGDRVAMRFAPVKGADRRIPVFVLEAGARG